MKSMLKVFFLLGWASLWIVTGLARTRDELTQDLSQFLIDQYGSIEQGPISTGILYDLAVPFSKISEFDGSDSTGIATVSQWLQMTHELKRAALKDVGIPPHEVFRTIGKIKAKNHVYPIAILNFHYQRIRPVLNPDSVLKYNQQGFTSVDALAFEEARVFAVSTLHSTTYRGAEVHFQMDLESRYITNDKQSIKHIEIDFDDGRGFRAVNSKEDLVVRYAAKGKKIITMKATLADGVALTGKFEFNVLALTTPNPTATWALQSTIPYNGQYSTGHAYLYLAEGHSVVTKPVIVPEGFDLDNSMNWDELYALLNQQNLVEDLRSFGYDAVVLNYTDATTYIQSNAFLVETLLDSINHVIDPTRESVLIGPSMGGLTTRYALAHMETTNTPHRIRTLVSFDSPQRGANIPLGIQYWVDFFSTESADAAFLRDALNSPAARQMLLTHFTNPPSTTAGSDPLRTGLLNDFTAVGNYPTLARLVAIANGSGSRQTSGFNPGDQLIYYQYRSFLVDINGNVWALHNTVSQRILDGMINRIWPFSDDYLTVTVQPTWPWDNAPGGMRSTMTQMDTTAVPYGDVVALHPNHCFIPTISSLDLAVTDPFFDIAGASNLMSLTPFDTLYFPVANQDHVEITPENYEWFMQETLDPLAAPQVVIKAESSGVRLCWPPVAGALSYRVYKTPDLQTWTEQYVTVGDTTWLDPATSDSLQFYQVKSSVQPLPLARGN